jgi:phosphatidate cytidylyltransferase
MRTRVISALIGAPLLIAAVLWRGGPVPFHGWPFAALVLAMILVALSEYFAGCRKLGAETQDGFGYAGGVLFLILATPMAPGGMETALPFFFTVLVVTGLIFEAMKGHPQPLKNLAPSWLGVMYIGWLFPYALRLRLLEGRALQGLHWTLPLPGMAEMGMGAWLVLFTILICTALDSGAYFVGKSLGKHKMAPVVSPGKTWEGAIGGFAAALLVGAGLGWWLKLPMAFALTAAALVGILGQLGDLSKSAIKREIGIKDFGTLIPGHGGVLDRFDSLLFAAPAVYWLAVFWR